MGAPNALNPKAQHGGCIYPVQEDEGLYASSQPLLVADRVRTGTVPSESELAQATTGRCSSAAKGATGPGAVRHILRTRSLESYSFIRRHDAPHLEATKRLMEVLDVLAWCCVRTGSVDSTCEA